MSDQQLEELTKRIESLEKRLKKVEMKYVSSWGNYYMQKDDPANDTSTQALVRKACIDSGMKQCVLGGDMMSSFFFRRTPMDYYSWTLDERRYRFG